MQTLYDSLAAIAARFPDTGFLAVPPRADRPYLPEGAEISFAQALAAVDALADAWGRAGWGPGHRVALALDNHPAHVLHFLALNRLGAAQVPVNPYYLPPELEYLLQHSEADIALALPWNVEKLTAAGELPVLEWDDGSEPARFAPPAPPRPATNDTPGPHSEIALIYTSGTTSRPKGAIIDNAFAFAVGRCYAEHGGALTVRDGVERIFLPLPYFHVNAGVNTLALALLKGVCMIVPDRFHADSFWQDIAATQASAIHYLGIIPPVLMKAAPGPQDRAHGLRYGLGAGLDPALHVAFEERFGFPMVEVWGMTETGRFLADCVEPRHPHTRAFGRPMPGHMEAMVVDDAGREVPRGSPGELVVRAPGPDPRQGFFRGYLKNPQATEEAWRDGWFHTGDVVTQAPDGMMHFVERAKNLIRRSGENISAAEVEDALIDCPDVACVAVVSVPDPMRDEEVMAAVVPAAGSAPDTATAERILAFGRDRLAYYKLPGWISFRDDLPVTGTQKVQKHRLFAPGADPFEGARDMRRQKAESRKGPA